MNVLVTLKCFTVSPFIYCIVFFPNKVPFLPPPLFLRVPALIWLLIWTSHQFLPWQHSRKGRRREESREEHTLQEPEKYICNMNRIGSSFLKAIVNFSAMAKRRGKNRQWQQGQQEQQKSSRWTSMSAQTVQRRGKGAASLEVFIIFPFLSCPPSTFLHKKQQVVSFPEMSAQQYQYKRDFPAETSTSRKDSDNNARPQAMVKKTQQNPNCSVASNTVQ